MCDLNPAVDLAGGVYYQKCYDPECRNYRSNYMPLPTALWQQYRQQPACQQGHSQQAEQQLQNGRCATTCSPSEDDECIQLLQQLEGQQGVQKQLIDVTATAAHNVSGVDTAEEDELCWQLLEEVENMAAGTNAEAMG